MERLGDTRPRGLHAGSLRTWGMLFLAAGIISRGILQNRILGIGGMTAEQLLEVISGSSMAVATAALVLQAMETCAVPIFVFLLVEGFTHTKDWKRYLLRVAGTAALSEIPYNLAISGSVLDLSSRNPAIGLVLGLMLMYFWQRYGARSMGNTLVKICVTAAAVVWVGMLRIDQGVPVVAMVGILWMLRGKPQLRVLAGSVAAMACSVISPFYLVSAMGFLPVHLYNGEPGEGSRAVNYLAYPAVLLALGLIGIFVF